MKLSIIVPVYNVEKYLERCLKSLCNLEIENEIIIINDGSKDKSLEIAEKFKKENNKENIVIVSQENKGLSEARNTGLKLAKGKYISFIDSDDFVLKKEFENIVNKAIEENVDVLIGNGIYYYEENSLKNSSFIRNENLEKIGIKTGKEWLLELEKYDNYRAEVWDDIYRREFLINNNLFFKKDRLHEDEVFTIEVLLKAEKVSYFKEPFYNYFQSNSGSIMSKKSLKNHTDMIKNVEDLLEISKNLENKKIERFIKNRTFSFYRRLLFDIYNDYRNEFKNIYEKYKQLYKEYKLYENVNEKTRKKSKLIYKNFKLYYFRQSLKYKYKTFTKKLKSKLKGK